MKIRRRLAKTAIRKGNKLQTKGKAFVVIGDTINTGNGYIEYQLEGNSNWLVIHYSEKVKLIIDN